MKVAHLTSVHSALDTRIFYKEAVTLAAAGYQVSVVAVAERDAVMQGVQLRAVPLRAQNRWHRMTGAVLAILRAAVAERAALYHFHDPELIPAALCLKAVGRRVIYDVHEDVPLQILSKHWIRSWLRRSVATATGGIETLSARLFDGIVAATPAIAKRFPPSKTVVVQNFPILEELANVDLQPYDARPQALTYVGGLLGIRGAREMINAMALLPDELGAHLVLAGRFGEPNLEAECRSLPGWSRVEFLGWQTRPEVAALLARVRVGLVIHHPAPNYLDAYPVKLFEYMAAGLPVIASDLPLMRAIIDSAGCGILVPHDDLQAIADAIGWLLEHPGEAEAMGQRGRAAVLATYNWTGEAEKLLAFYHRLFEGDRSRAEQA